MAPSAREIVLELKSMTVIMEQARSLLATADDSNKDSLKQHLERIDSKITQCQDSLSSKNLSSFDWASFTAGALCSSEAVTSLLEERACSAYAYTDLLLVATDFLKQLDKPLTIGFHELQIFELVWDIITDAGLYQNEWPSYWPPVIDVIGEGPLCEAVNDLLRWQLAFTRGASHAWLCTQSLLSPSPYQMQVRMFRNSRATLTGTNHLIYLEGDDLRLLMARLPTNLISNMCCLANEQMGPSVRKRSTTPSSSQATTPDELHGIAYGELFYRLVFMVSRCLGDFDSSGMPISRPEAWGEAHLSPALFESAGLTLLASNTRSTFLDGCKSCDTFTLGTEGKKRSVLFALNVMRRTLELSSGQQMRGLVWNPQAVDSRRLLDTLREFAEDYSSAVGKEAVAVIRLLKRAATAAVGNAT